MAKRLSPERMAKIKADLAVKRVAKIGFPERKNHPDGNVPVAYIAAIQEFGYPEGGIPSRSFMRSTISARKDVWKETMRKGVNAVIKGTHEVDDVLESVGAEAAGDMRKTLNKLQEPPLKESTKAARRRRGITSTKPLNATGYMLATLTHSVEAP